MRKRGKKLPIFVLLASFFLGCGISSATEADELLQLAQKQTPKRYDYALRNHAQIQPTRDQKSFFLLWLPEKSKHDPIPIIVSLHGHGSWVFDEFFLWHQFAKERGCGILALQWWLGKGERFQDYLSPHEIYRAVDDVFKAKFPKSPALFHGFSRGSANSYAVAALDVDSGNRYFKLIIANSGKPSLDFPPNVQIEKGQFGDQPLRGTRWITYAGAHDTHPARDGFRGMREAKVWIEKYGGKVVLAIEDPEGDHGGFHRNPKNINKALDVFEEILKDGS